MQPESPPKVPRKAYAPPHQNQATDNGDVLDPQVSTQAPKHPYSEHVSNASYCWACSPLLLTNKCGQGMRDKNPRSHFICSNDSHLTRMLSILFSTYSKCFIERIVSTPPSSYTFDQDQSPIPLRNELIMERNASIQVRPSIDALKHESQEIENEIKELQVYIVWR